MKKTTKRPKKGRGGSKPHRGAPASIMIRVRLTPKEHEDLLFWAEGDVSEYVRTATRRYHEVFCLLRYLEWDLEKRALSPFECNLLATVNPDEYLQLGGAELMKRPDERPREPERGPLLRT